MDKPIRVLVFPAGEINSIELHDALASSVNVEVFGASSVDRHGPYVFKNYISGLPLISDDGFIDSFNRVLSEHHIDVVFPTHDSVATFFADNEDALQAKLVVADKETSAICRDKSKTYEVFADTAFVPKIYTDPSEVELPVFVKPRVGQGSVGATLIEEMHQLTGLPADEMVLSEYLPGEEYTIDCLTNRHGKLQVASPRIRERTMAGVSVAAYNIPQTEEIQQIAETINERLTFRGLWFFQLKQNKDGQLKLLEVSTRCAGTMCLTRVLGANLPLLSVYTVMGYDVETIPNDYKVTLDRTLISRYKIEYEYDTVYLDFDDTLVVRGQVLPYAIWFVYQCKAQDKTVHLITKHENDIHETLKQYGISEELFSSIIHLEAHHNKIDNIKPERAIFIDNAFQERKFVHDTFGIPVFDVDALEALIDWRL